MLRRPAPVRSPDDDAFWQHVLSRRLMLQRCDSCSRVRYPPAPCCPGCLSEEATWSPMSGRGEVVSWVTFRKQYFPALPAPYVVIAVQHEEGPLMFGNVDPSYIGTLRAGTPVRVTFEDCLLDDGSPFVVPQWLPRDVAAPAAPGAAA
jgi:uncharacterized OB-fold protein